MSLRSDAQQKQPLSQQGFTAGTILELGRQMTDIEPRIDPGGG